VLAFVGIEFRFFGYFLVVARTVLRLLSSVGDAARTALDLVGHHPMSRRITEVQN
jgi:hypothetical protein